jgi:branched-chain amino acid aminotransferase
MDGRFIPRDEARLAIHDAGLVFGAAVTDFCRTFRHRLFRWSDHLARFRRDCSVCFIPLQPNDAELTSAACELVAHNAALLAPEQELALVSFATPGPLGLYAGEPGADGPPTVCLHTFPLPFSRYTRFFSEGLRLECVGRHDADDDDLAPPRVKHRSRLHWWRADQLARRAALTSPAPGARLALLQDRAGFVTETAVGNLLVVRDGRVLTPGSRALEGISVRVVEELCTSLGIPFARDESLTLEGCRQSSEAMLCGSAFCLAGVRWIDGHELPWPGPVTARLLAAWGDQVGIDIAGQFLGPSR